MDYTCTESFARRGSIGAMLDQFYPVAEPAEPVRIQLQSPTLVSDSRFAARQERNWRHLQQTRSIRENAELLHVSHATSTAILAESSITYRDIVGIRACGTPHSAPYRALSALAVVVSSDGKWLLFERDSGDWPHSYELPGGFVRAAKAPATVDAFISERVEREVTAVTVVQQQCVGYHDFASILEHMYVYEIHVREPAAEVEAHYGAAVLALTPAAVAAHASGSIQSRLPLHEPSRRVVQALLAHQENSPSNLLAAAGECLAAQ